MSRAVVFIIILLITLPSYGQQVDGTVNRDTVGVGDAIRYTLTVPQADRLNGVVYPEDEDFGHDFDLIESKIYSGTHADSAVYDLRYFGGQDAAVPELQVGLISGNDTLWVTSPLIPLQFSALADDENAPFRPFKPLYEFSVSLLPYILAVLLVIVLGWIAWSYYSRLEKPAIPEPVKPVEIPQFKDPLKGLEQDIESVKKNFPHPESDYKAYYSRLGDAIRAYYEDLYTIPALESTTSELARAMRDKMVDKTLGDPTLNILQQADMVKFAKFVPEKSQCLQTMKEAEHFLNQARIIDGPRVESMKLRHDEAVKKLTETESNI